MIQEEGAGILIVDDNSDNLKVLGDALKDIISDIRVAIDGEMALASIEAKLPELILLDIQMPHLDGYGVCERLKADTHTQDIPIIFISAFNSSFNKVKGFELGAVDYIPKPFEIEEVRARVKTHLALSRQKQELVKLNQEKNNFIGMAAHDLRNPLGVISGYINLMLKNSFINLNESQKRYVQHIANSSHSMLRLIDDLLNLSTIESGTLLLNRLETDIHSLIQDVLFLFEAQATNKRITIKYNIAESITERVMLDKEKIKQVLNNLISNAIKYSHSDTQISILVFQEEHNIIIEIKDQGQGIPQDEITDIFVPFRKTSVSTTAGEDSTGLGLAIAQRIVNGHGGDINVSSEVGVGTTFHVSLPMNAPV